MCSFAVAVGGGPAQRGEQAVVLGDVVGGDTEAAVQLGEHLAVRPLDVDAVARGTGIASGAAVYVGGRPLSLVRVADHEVWVAAAGAK